MQFGFLGIDYKNADLTIRDEISFTDQKKLEFFHKAEKIGVEQVMILSTCNRSEIYYFFDDEQQIKKIQNIYCDMFDKAEIEQYIRHCEEDKAVSYLFQVTAGLESMVLGEDQILGQVKDALDFSRTMGFSKKELNKVVRDAITCAKKVKTTFRISEKPVSVGYIGICELQKICDIKDKMVLVILQFLHFVICRNMKQARFIYAAEHWHMQEMFRKSFKRLRSFLTNKDMRS